MDNAHNSPLRCFQFDTFLRAELTHAVFTRNGGVSPEPWASLNFGISTGDAPERAAENRRRAFEFVGREPASIADLWQVHSANVLTVTEPHVGGARLQNADGMVTNRTTVTLFMRFADCVPVLLFDPVKRAIGIVHAGWKGTALKAAAAGVQRMAAEFGSRPADVLAGIGPSIGPDHYEVGPEVVERIKASFPHRWPEMVVSQARNNGGVHLDLWEANRVALEEAGVRQIEVAGICTACHTADYFSHRAEHGRTGRFGALLALT